MPHPIMRLAVAAGVLAIGLSTSGCTRVRSHTGYLVDPLLVDSIQPGIDNRASVERTLGHPSFTGEFDTGEYYYFSRDSRQLAFSKPKPVAQTILRIRFDAAGNVSSVDKQGMEQVAKINPMKTKTPTLGRDRSFFQEIFGNIGAVGAPGTGAAGPTGAGPNGS